MPNHSTHFQTIWSEQNYFPLQLLRKYEMLQYESLQGSKWRKKEINVFSITTSIHNCIYNCYKQLNIVTFWNKLRRHQCLLDKSVHSLSFLHPSLSLPFFLFLLPPPISLSIFTMGVWFCHLNKIGDRNREPEITGIHAQ